MYERINRRFEVLFFRRINKAIKNRISSFTAILKESGFDAARSWLNSQLVNPDLTKEIERLYKVVGLRHANMTFKALKKEEKKSLFFKGFGFNDEWVRFIVDYLRSHLIEKITFDVNTTTRNYLLRVLSKAVEEGWGVDETVRNLSEANFSEMQAARIVRTEVNTAANAGVLAAGKTYDYEMMKEWVSVEDFRTRGRNGEDHANHVALNGQVKDYDDVFIDPRNGDRLQAPGDPKASAASIINCRCNLVLKPKRDANGRLIPKRRSTVVIFPSINRQRVVTI